MSSNRKEITVRTLSPHPAQLTILNERRRFNVIKCGRRFGKTCIFEMLAKESIIKRNRFAYFAPTYKMLSDVWAEMNQTFFSIIKSKSETLKQATFLGGAVVDFWSMDDPDSGRGRAYHRAIIDECEAAPKFQQAWEEAIRATLTDYKGDAYLLSTPKFGDTFFKRVCKNQDILDDWKTFVFTTYDNPYIDPRELEEARILLGESIFNCEYLAMDVDGKSVNPFMMQFDRDKHVKPCGYDPAKQLIISMDFNLNPFSVIFCHLWQDASGMHFHTFDEAEIESGSIPAMVDLIKLRYQRSLPTCIITGDYMGMRGDISVRDNSSLYDQIQKWLNLRPSQIRTYPNPKHENSRADCNYVLYHLNDVRIDQSCKGMIRDMAHVQCDAYGSILKRDRKDLNQRADYMDAWRYVINSFLKDWIKRHHGINYSTFAKTINGQQTQTQRPNPGFALIN